MSDVMTNYPYDPDGQRELFPRLIHVWGYGFWWYAGPVMQDEADCVFMGLYVKQFSNEQKARAWQKENQGNVLQSGTGSNSLH